MAGLVPGYDKPGAQVDEQAELEVEHGMQYVSRGGEKLAHGLDRLGVDPAGLDALDVGASTGGFTDVLLQRGAARVIALDVGYGQLHLRLRDDPRVVVLERTNARRLGAAEIPEPIDLVTCDASFIGLETVLPAALGLAKREAHLVALIKPQFEVGPERVGKGGVVRDPALHQEVCARIAAWLTGRGWVVAGIVESPIRGPEGNVEFLVYARRD
jgi:23S rRNA (cytidine1920-2'-O)/16S rRNA (cytidine1409-2'-O)-methyltransferase